jgi:hypothetical protein
MPISLNHTIVVARDKLQSAQFLCEILGLPGPKRLGYFVVAQVGDTSLDFLDTDEAITRGISRFSSARRSSTTSLRASGRVALTIGPTRLASKPRKSTTGMTDAAFILRIPMAICWKSSRALTAAGG